ncbi:MAG: GNAT family N-acetyltransferase [Acidimicrobiales bacterium]|nr:GNAT family N-acetyltransferase [Acidimicrobiales bacterium]MBO0893970.1 GNAT family N-acetyltransferase [Acidimicrobiales bacterium]
MRDDDVAAAEGVWHRAASSMRVEHGLPPRPYDEEVKERTRRGMHHLLSTDPDGCWVAVTEGEVVGLAQAIRRERLWVLSLLGVVPEQQALGLGRMLLEAAIPYGGGGAPGMIMSSRDPRAVRRYAKAGFEVRPTMAAWGRVRVRDLPVPPGLRPGGLSDRPVVDAVDRALRGAHHGPDLDHLLQEGHRLVLLDDVGYAVCREARPVLLGATSEEAAEALLLGVLAGADPDEAVELGWVTGDQQWAISAAVRAGLELHPSGPLMVRGDPGPLRPYLPSGAFG